MFDLEISLDCSPYERVANILRWDGIVEVLQGQDSRAVVRSSMHLRHLQQRVGRAEDGVHSLVFACNQDSDRLEGLSVLPHPLTPTPS